LIPEQTHGVLDLLDSGVVQLDRSGRILLMNSAAENCLLVSRDRARGRYIGEVASIPGDLRDAILHMPEGSQCLRLHELKLGNSLYDRNLGHEVRNPLGGIRGAAQMLADELEIGELATLARLIMRESDRIDELIQRFGHQELDCREVDLYPLLDEALDLLAAEFGESVAIERDYDPSLPSISADSTAIRRVILNLLRNACQAGASVVLIKTRVEYQNTLLHSGQGSVIKLQVIDNGQGVPESLRSLLFLPLVTGRRDGTGLGLALSQQIASAHGGLLTYEPLEQGSCFSFWLPFGNGQEVTGKGASP
jgi:two-component system nitrogen regulation sensor histidine kinase GlnL